MLTLYFSGTGNSAYIANAFAKKTNHVAYSIESDINFKQLISESDTIAFCYPIYTSCVPLIMRTFVSEHLDDLNGKKLILLCTQLMFSGDGARVFTDLLSGITYTVLYAEHFNMPNNICNLKILPLASPKKFDACLERADEKLNQVVRDIENGIVRKRGFSPLSKWMGYYSQRKYFPKLEEKHKKDVRVTDACVRCGLCVKICPMKNLTLSDKKALGLGNCTLCYRCVNQCPKQAITVFIHNPVKQQYHFNKSFSLKI